MVRAKIHAKSNSPEDRFEALVIKTESHWFFGNPFKQDEYKRFYVSKGKSEYSHRYAWKLWVGPIPKGFEIDHVCKVKSCVRPHSEHTEAVTRLVNWDRATSPPRINKLKTHCNNGHEYTKENTIIDKSGWRRCRKCANQYARNRMRKVRIK